MNAQNFKRKKVIVMGLGLHGGGAGTAVFFARAGAKVLVTDLKNRRELAAQIKKMRHWKNIRYRLGEHRASDFQSADFIIKNPGVPEHSRFLTIARRRQIPILSDIEIFFRLCPSSIIGVTGTKGKSTTATLVAEFLKRGQKKRIWLAGNIRKSVLDILPATKKDDIVVLELSSFQLDSLAHSGISPHIALITNIFPDHLNRYRNFQHYALSKTQIFRFQKHNDFLFIPKNGPLLARLAKNARGKKIVVAIRQTLRPWMHIVEKHFPAHQYPSVALAVAVARHCGVRQTAINPVRELARGIKPRMRISKLLKKKKIIDFHAPHQFYNGARDRGAFSNGVKMVLSAAKSLEGRLETVGRIFGINFINDTTATNPEAALAALREIRHRNQKSGIILIAGGYDKKLPVGEFANAMQTYAKAVVFLPGRATVKMKSKIQNSKNKTNPKFKKQKNIGIVDAKNMMDAVKKAYGFAERGDTVLLSPGAASFGLFQNEFDRGAQFVKEVKRLR